MDYYLTLKLLHILAAVVVAGTGAGIAFFMLMAYRSGNPQAICITTRHVVLGDWLFTMPGVIVLFVTGVMLISRLGLSYTSPWSLTVIGLFVFIGLCWLPVLHIQYRLRALASKYQDGPPSRPDSFGPTDPSDHHDDPGDPDRTGNHDDPGHPDRSGNRDRPGQSAHSSHTLSPEFHRLMRQWIVLGILAFTAVLVVFYLMVFKPLPLV